MVTHGPLAANPILWPKPPGGDIGCPISSAQGSYSALLLVGLAMRVLLPKSPGGLLLHRFTLTHADMGGFISWRPSSCLARALLRTIALWSPDFPRGNPRGHPATRAYSAPT